MCTWAHYLSKRTNFLWSKHISGRITHCCADYVSTLVSCFELNAKIWIKTAVLCLTRSFCLYIRSLNLKLFCCVVLCSDTNKHSTNSESRGLQGTSPYTLLIHLIPTELYFNFLRSWIYGRLKLQQAVAGCSIRISCWSDRKKTSSKQSVICLPV